MSKVEYLLDKYPDTVFSRKPVQRYGMMQLAPGQGADGYGSKISTDYMADIGDGRRRRVYCICYSNAGSLYVLDGGVALYVRHYDIPDDVRNS